MEPVVACPDCGTPGRCVGRDAKARAIFCCSRVDCDVVEYDRDVIRHRATGITEPADWRGLVADDRSRRGRPYYWSRRAR